MTTPNLRVHPTIGLSRVGNSTEYYLGPETIAALPQRNDVNSPTKGGLPIVPGTDKEPISSSHLRDGDGAMKRQAARFRIYHYPDDATGVYPAPGGVEIQIGSTIDDRTVTDIVWTVHVANKKAASFTSDDDHGVHAYVDGQTPVLRNMSEGLDPHNILRLRKLVIDPGPRAIRGTDSTSVAFDVDTGASHGVDGEIVPLDYPKTFPNQANPLAIVNEPQGPIETLGELQTDEAGRLIVTGGHGRTAGWEVDPGAGAPMADAVNNNQWFDDTSDGPVTATVVFDQGPPAEVHPAWVVTTDPSYAPQTLNVVSLWDEAYDSFVRNLDLDPDIYHDGAFDPSYHPSFPEQIHPFFTAAAQQQWNTYLPEIAIDAHRAVGAITADDDPLMTIMAGLAFIRKPETGDELSWVSEPSDVGAPLMPLALGDTSKSGGKSFLSPTVTQYFFLERWAANAYDKSDSKPLGDGEYLDRATLQNCLGGRFSPGIDIGFVIREPEMYQDWKAGGGPFRIKHEPLDYSDVHRNGEFGPFLTLGWLPRHPEVQHLGLQPGDVSKFLALPWQADYNSCAIHQTSPNELNSNSLYWSWPGQRPVTVYVADDYQAGDGSELPAQRYSVRGPGTMPGTNSPTDGADLANAGRFWLYPQMLDHWNKIGTIVQATAIDDGRSYPDPDLYLEVQSQLENDEPELADPHPWPMIAGNGSARRKAE